MIGQLLLQAIADGFVCQHFSGRRCRAAAAIAAGLSQMAAVVPFQPWNPSWFSSPESSPEDAW
jgi:hypothetical protein